MKKLTILRKRFIPLEVVDISGDELLFSDEELLVTRWKAIHSRADISRGVSFTLIKEGLKIARFYDHSGKFLYWYCDIVDILYDTVEDTYTLTDLLLDVKFMADGTFKVLDADELAAALEQDLITTEQACRALRKLDEILNMIYDGSFPPVSCRQEQYWLENG